MAWYPSAGQVLRVAPVKGKVKKVEIKESHHWACPYARIETQKIISVKGHLGLAHLHFIRSLEYLYKMAAHVGRYFNY